MDWNHIKGTYQNHECIVIFNDIEFRFLISNRDDSSFPYDWCIFFESIEEIWRVRSNCCYPTIEIAKAECELFFNEKLKSLLKTESFLNIIHGG